MRHTGFTLIEILATLLIAALGMATTIAILVYASRLSAGAVSAATGLTTAWSALHDARPGWHPGDLSSSGLQVDTSNMTFNSGTRSFSGAAFRETRHGFLNGFYVRRVEESTTSDVGDSGTRFVTVTVDVYEDRAGGALVGSVRQRLLRKAP